MNSIMNINSDGKFYEVDLNNAWNWVNKDAVVYFSWNSQSSSSGHIATGIPTKELQTIEINGEKYEYGNVIQAGSKVGQFPLLGEGGVYSNKKASQVQAFVLVSSVPGLAEWIDKMKEPIEPLEPIGTNLIPNPIPEPQLKLK